MPADAPYPSYKESAASFTIATKSNPELQSVNVQVLEQVLQTL